MEMSYPALKKNEMRWNQIIICSNRQVINPCMSTAIEVDHFLIIVVYKQKIYGGE